MDAPIISPWFFYFVSVAHNIKCLCSIFAIIGILLALVALFLGYESKEPKLKAVGIKLLKASIVCTIITIIVPSERTCYKMIAASMVTPKNIEALGENTDKALDVLVEKIVKAANEAKGDK